MMSAFVESPCKGCEIRQLHCHSTCSNYSSYQAKIAEIKTKIQAEKDEQAFIDTIKSGLSKKHKRSDNA